MTCYSKKSVPMVVAIVGIALAADAFAAPPTLESVVPPTADASGGERVTITGTGFTGATSVTFDGVEADDVVVWTPIQISCTVPPHWAGPVSVVVLTPDGRNGANQAFTYTSQRPAPTVTSVTPASGISRGGTDVTLVGTALAGAASVKFDGVPATNVSVVSDTELRCTTPVHPAGAVSVVVTTPDGSNGANALFTFIATATPPRVDEVSPESGGTGGGTLVTLEGTGFLGATSVTFGGERATNVVVVSETELHCLTPPHRQGAVSVVVTTPDGSNGANTLFTYVGGGWVALNGAGPPWTPSGIGASPARAVVESAKREEACVPR